MLVGRDRLLQAGEAALRGAAAGQGRLLLLTGEAGIGKTTLARAIADRAVAAGALVRTGACWESEGLPAFTPWLDVLHRPGGDACAAAAAHLEGDGTEAPDASGAQRALGRRFATVIDALRSCADEVPQVVVLEDLHWADEPTLALLVALAAHLPTMPVLVVATYRDDELAQPGALASVGGNADRIALAGLDEAAVATLLESVLARPATDEERAVVQRQTAGNPLFVTQVARLLGSGSSSVPTGVREVLARRLARTSSACDRVLGAASVLGVEFDEATLDLLAGKPVSGALDEAAAARLVTASDGAPGRWRFVHALVQATRYELLPGRDRAELHGAALVALEGRADVSAATLAHHAARGRFEPDDPRPAAVLVGAGAEALARLAWADAVSLYERALGCAPAGDAGAALRAEAWLGIGAARLRQGRDARGAFDEAAALGRAIGRGDLVARAALGFSVGLGAFEVRLLDHHQIELLDEAADALDDDAVLLPLVLARLSVALAFVGSADRRLELAARAVDLARTGGDPVALGHALAAWCDARADPDHVEERLAAATEAVTLAQRAGDLPLELLGRRLRVVALLEQSDHGLADLEVAAYERAAARLGDPLYTWYGALWRATRAAAEGRPHDALALLQEADDLGALGGSTNSRLLVHVHELMTAADARDRAAVDVAMAAVLSYAPGLLTPYADITSAYCSTALGDLDRARHFLARVPPERPDELSRDSEWMSAMVQLAWAASRVGDLALVRQARAWLEPVAGCAPVEGIGAYLHGSTHRFLALLAAVEGDRDASRRHIAAARTAAQGGGTVLAALTDVDAAWALRRIGDPADAPMAVDLARRAAAAFQRADLAVLASEADALAAGGPDPVAPAAVMAPAIGAPPTLSRVGDTWAWTWQGRTVHVRDAKGVADLAVLLGRAGREVHVRELEGVATKPAGGRQDVLDATAVEQYRQRLHDLEDDLDEADRLGDRGQAEVLAAERDALVAQLTSAFGLGGRPRVMAGDPDERLRKAVSARVRASIDRIEQLDAPLGRHLRSAVRTGYWCSYQPEHPVPWVVTPG